VIEQVLNCLEKLADRCAAGQKLDGSSAQDALDFFRNFADRCHHVKEEGHLFPLLEARGLPRAGGPTGVMCHEHDEGRRLSAALATAVAQDNSGEFMWHARAYVQLLRDHIRKEDHCLSPMAAGILSDTEAEALVQSFATVESADMGEGTHERYLQLANDLADRLDVPRTPAVSTCGHACGHRQLR
jgi:hemerythrin-like domain-containing protein